jgi:hypothetical protein
MQEKEKQEASLVAALAEAQVLPRHFRRGL